MVGTTAVVWPLHLDCKTHCEQYHCDAGRARTRYAFACVCALQRPSPEPPTNADPPPAGNVVGLAPSPLLLAAYGWRGMFLVFGALGVPLLLMWLRVVPDAPSAATPSNLQPGQAGPGAGAAAAASAFRKDVTVMQLLTSTATWAIIVANVVNHFGYFIYLSWMPTYFRTVGRAGGTSSTRVQYRSIFRVPWGGSWGAVRPGRALENAWRGRDSA